MFRATAGVWTAGSGLIMRPRASEIRYLTQRPYLPPGTLREIFGNGAPPDNRSDEPILALLRELNLERVVTEAGGLDSERDWLTLLSLREQQLVAFMQVLLSAPQFVLLDRIGGTLRSANSTRSYSGLPNVRLPMSTTRRRPNLDISMMRFSSAGRTAAGSGRR